MSVVCEEIFDEVSQPSVEEIRDYANKIGIDPDAEPQLLPLAAEGLMTALPPGWKPCYDETSESYYYYNNLTNKTQWEHPLDDVYRGLVKKARTESQSFSLGEPTEDATYARDDIPSYEEPHNLSSKKLGAIKKKDIKLSPLKTKPKLSDFNNPELIKQKSEEQPIQKLSLNAAVFKSFDDDNSTGSHFEKHPRNLEKPELKVVGGGAMFLKQNTKKVNDTPVVSPSEPNAAIDLLMGQPRSILRERSLLEPSKSLEFDKISAGDKSEKEDDDKKSVRFNLDNTTDIAFTLSDNSSNSDELGLNKLDEVINVKLTNKPKSRFTVSPVPDGFLDDDLNSNNTNLKLIKPNPSDFIKPKLTISRGSDSDDDSIFKLMDRKGRKNEPLIDSDNSEESPINNNNNNEEIFYEKTKKLKERSAKKVERLKQSIWEEKNSELLKFKEDVENSQQQELERILVTEKSDYEDKIKTELEHLRVEMENRNAGTLKEERLKFDENLEKMRAEIKVNIDEEEKKLKEYFETKKNELEKYYDEKLADTEKELAERMEINRDELIATHNSIIEQLRQNHRIIIDELKKELQAEEDELRKEHQNQMTQIKNKMDSDPEKNKSKSGDEQRMYEKVRCEKRLLEDKYRCLKDKYLRLKTDVKLSIEKRNRRKEQSATNTTTTTTTTTGSETERSHSNKDRTPLNSPRKNFEKPPTPKYSKIAAKTDNRPPKTLIIQDLDTSTSDRSYQSEDKLNKNNDSSDNGSNPGRSRKKLFSRLKSSSTSRVNNNAKSKKIQRSCSPVENLRRQLQKLEDLEDQFPQNPQADTYHLRYPFSDGQKFEGSSELEFFRHRIHLERDSIKRAKESLRTQKTLFQQRQKELKLKHGTMARHTLQQLCQVSQLYYEPPVVEEPIRENKKSPKEEKELTDMEVSLHRTRSLLGEKVIRLRHLEQSLQRATLNTEQTKQEDTTLSDISSHSASSGISSTEFATADANVPKGIIRGEHFQESSEIIQSLENLNSEIREIWDVLRQQQQQSNLSTVIPPFVYPDLGWPILAGAATVPVPPSIPTLADRLHNYRQHIALANTQSTVVTHANQGATTTLVERTRNLRHWLRQAGIDNAAEGMPPQATL